MMQVYRVEHNKRPKTGRSGDIKKLSRHWNYLPCPQDDGIGSMSSLDVCGTTNKTDFYKWWYKSKLKHIISDKDYKIVVLDVQKKYVRIGEHQCVFPRSKATIIGTLNELGQTVYNEKHKGK